jgi:RNA polymerase sigma factor (TIGR02999 family)
MNRDVKNNKKIDDLLDAVNRQEDKALDELVAAIYPELKRLAHFQIAGERAGHTLNTTAIVHEAYVRLAAGEGNWSDRAHFLRAAATVMRHLLVDHARRRSADKRGGGVAPVTLDVGIHSEADDSVAVIALDDAIREIAKIDPRLERIIECRYFAGLSVAETAEALEMKTRTVERDWQRARAYLRRAMETNAH